MKRHFSNKQSEGSQYLVIAGTTKSASTSLHVYLSDHPDISGLILKESGYWLDESYPFSMGYRYTHPELNYTDCYPVDQSSPVKLDVTPDYIYSKGTPQRIKDNLQHCTIYFTLREPISRLVSKFRYLKQQDRIPKKLSIDEYSEKLLKQTHPLDYEIPQEYRTLDQGEYARYVQRYLDTFGKEKVRVIYFEELTQSPRSIIQKICNDIEIDPSFYNDYPFPIVNRTRTIRSKKLERGYHALRKKLSSATDKLPRIHNAGIQIKQKIQPLVYRLNGDTERNNNIQLSGDMWLRLRDHYTPFVVQLNKNFPVPDTWKEHYNL